MLELFWNEWFWLPHGYTWADVEPTEDLHTPTARELLIWGPVCAVVLLVIRNYILLPFVLNPIGKLYNVRSKPYRPPAPNPNLDTLYAINRARPPRHLLEQSSADIGLTNRQVERWLRQKALSQQMTTLEKFNDHGWQFTYYSLYCIAGLIIVTSKPWYADVMKVFEDYPLQSVPRDIWWYYMISIGFYLVQTYLLLKNDRKRDFYQMLTHHGFTMGILTFCWVTNIVRLCSLSLLFHECVDIILSLGKLFSYCGYPQGPHNLAAPFVVTWFVTRLYLYPVYVMGTSFYLAPFVGGTLCPSLYLLQVFMTGLFVLHLMWTMEIIPYIKKFLFTSESVCDERSSPEELSDDNSRKLLQTGKEERTFVLAKPG